MPQAEQNKLLITRFMAALNDGDDTTLREIMHEDAKWWILGAGTMDRETLIEQLHLMLGGAKVSGTKIIAMTAEGERVAVEAEGNFEFADGRVYNNSYHNLYIIQDGRITYVKEYLDTALVARVFGALPEFEK
jgi:hypothetical protein